MLIGIDASKISSHSKTGIENTVYYLVQNLLKLDTANKYILYSQKKLPPEFTFKNTEERLIPLAKFWHKFRLPLALFKDKPDVFLELSNKLPAYCPKKSVVFVHDLAFKYFPEAYSKYELYLQENAINNIISKATKIVVSSESNRCDIIKFYGVKNISVVPLAYDDSIYNHQSDSKKGDYFLFVGRLEKRKNLENIVKSFKIFLNTFPHYKLVLVGKTGYGWKEVENEINSDPKIRERVKIVGFVENAKLSILYQQAKALVFPSLYEGFGYPILESMASGTPVITSKISTIEAVAKENVLYVKPLDGKSITNAMTRIVTDSALENKLIKGGLKHCRTFTWQKSAAALLKIINNL